MRPPRVTLLAAAAAQFVHRHHPVGSSSSSSSASVYGAPPLLPEISHASGAEHGATPTVLVRSLERPRLPSCSPPELTPHVSAALLQVLDLGGGDMLLEIFGHIGCTFTLQRVAASCRTFRHLLLRRGTAAAAPIWAAAWLTVPVMEETEEGGSHQLVTAAGALRRAPPGERIRLRAGGLRPYRIDCARGTTLSGEVVCAQPVVLEAEAAQPHAARREAHPASRDPQPLVADRNRPRVKIAHFHGRSDPGPPSTASSRDPHRPACRLLIRGRPSALTPLLLTAISSSLVPGQRRLVGADRLYGRLVARRPRRAPSRSVPPPPSPSATEPLCS